MHLGQLAPAFTTEGWKTFETNLLNYLHDHGLIDVTLTSPSHTGTLLDEYVGVALEKMVRSALADQNTLNVGALHSSLSQGLPPTRVHRTGLNPSLRGSDYVERVAEAYLASAVSLYQPPVDAWSLRIATDNQAIAEQIRNGSLKNGILNPIVGAVHRAIALYFSKGSPRECYQEIPSLPVCSIQRLNDTHIDDVPRNTLYKLSKPLMVDEEVVGRPDDYLLVRKPEDFPPNIFVTLDALRKENPDTAYVTLRRGPLIILVRMTPHTHDGAGQAFTSGMTPETPGQKSNIAPSLITAQAVGPVTSKAGQLAKGQPLVLAVSYQCIVSYHTTSLSPIEEEYVPTPAASGNVMAFAMTLMMALFLRKGTSIELTQEGNRLFLRNLDNQNDSFEMDPNCELTVWLN